MRTFACVLKTGGDYTALHVQILQRMVCEHIPTVKRFVCLTDVKEIEGVETLPLTENLPGKYSMLEVFRLKGPVLVTGLDTILLRNLDHLFDVVEDSDANTFWAMHSFGRRRQYANGIMGWSGDWAKLITKYPAPNPQRYRLEMEYTFWKLMVERANVRMFNSHVEILSYKKHVRDSGLEAAPESAGILMFHGQPRPQDVAVPWIQELYWGKEGVRCD